MRKVAGMAVVYVGGGNGNILVCTLSADTGKLTLGQSVFVGSYPSFLCLGNDGRFGYAVNEDEDQIAAFELGAGGVPKLLNQVPSPGGPAYVSLDQTGRFVFSANYGGGTVMVFPVAPDGSLGEPCDTQSTGLNPHAILTDPSNRFVFVPNKGSDRLSQFCFDSQRGRLLPNQPDALDTQPGAGPRHLAFHPSGGFAFLINENNSTLSGLAFDAERGTFSMRQTVSTLPAGLQVANNTGADVHVHPSGRFVYGSNRVHDSIAVFAVSPNNFELSLIGHESTRGQIPRNFAISPAGDLLLVANQESKTIVSFRIDPGTGKLTFLSETLLDTKAFWVGWARR